MMIIKGIQWIRYLMEKLGMTSYKYLGIIDYWSTPPTAFSRMKGKRHNYRSV